jgi:aspartate kinase/aspartokinase/homoserine dehydrogenase 1
MHKIVLKVGGSNLKSIENFSRIISLMKTYEQPAILVVSAFYGVTDCLEKAVSDENYTGELLEHLRHIHRMVLERYVMEKDRLAHASQELTACLSTLEELLSSKERHQDATINEILSFGEKISARVIQAILDANAVACRLALPGEMGFVSNQRFYQGSILLKKSSLNLKRYFDSDITYVVPGFYGISEQGKTILLGRGGTDYSAACIAHCVGASYLDVWKDVEGYLSGDPKIISGVKRISHLSYQEAAELSYFGAKILHPRTIRPLVSKRIQVRLFNPEKHLESGIRNEATRISYKITTGIEVIKSVTSDEDIALLKLKGSGVGIKKGILAEVTGAFDKAHINIRSVVTSQTAIHFIFSRANLQAAKQIVDKINRNLDFDTEINEDIAWVAAVGQGINQKEGIAARIFTALAKAGINVQQIVLGASEVAIYFVVQRKLVSKAVQSIHQEIFNHNNH